jgi:glycosyltransferase involved in cell wall biosynthesis
MIKDKNRIRICIIGPLPPPYGGMAVQTAKLQNLLQKEGLKVKTLPVNISFPKRFCFIDNLKYIRAMIRLLFYIVILCERLKRVDLIHILSNSYLSFFLYTTPAVFIGKFFRCKVIINYRGGEAQDFFEKYKWVICRILKMADAIIVPSEFLMGVFMRYNFTPDIVPNIVNLKEFHRIQRTVSPVNSPIRLFVARNLERIYNVPCAIRTFQHIQKVYPKSKLIIIGEGKEEIRLKCLVSDMNLDGVLFLGRVNNQDLPDVYGTATVALNPSDADNLPISVLEAFASGVPVISTNVGGIPYMIKDGVTGLLVNRNDDKGMAQCVLRLIKDERLYRKISKNGHKEAQKYSWEHVRPRLFSVYNKVFGEDGGSL